jgi:hypothetical protein
VVVSVLAWLDRLGRVLLAAFEDLGRFFSIMAQASPRAP